MVALSCLIYGQTVLFVGFQVSAGQAHSYHVRYLRNDLYFRLSNNTASSGPR